jgi:two-component system, OmpR family, sensor histidine kinase KdpD
MRNRLFSRCYQTWADTRLEPIAKHSSDNGLNMPRPARPSPETLLKLVEAEERSEQRGKLKIFLGYASGVGKSFRMLDEGRRRKLRGQDVVVAATQPSAGRDVDELLRGFEVIPPRREGEYAAIDVDAVLRRHPAVCLIDGLAYRNPPGSKNLERWQDVEELLAASISVITSINLQYIQEKQQQVEAIRGKSARESVPEAFIRTADEIEVVDAAPEYCVTHSLEGRSESDAVQLEHQLSQLREIALVLAAEVVDHQLEGYREQQGFPQVSGAHERILVCITPRSNASLMIRRGRRQADRFHGDLFAVYVQQNELDDADRRMLEQNLAAAREARAHVETLDAEDTIAAILKFAGENGITQIFVGHSQREGFMSRWRPNPVERLIMEADGIDVRVFPHDAEPHEAQPHEDHPNA